MNNNEIRPEEIWNEQKMNDLKAFISTQTSQQSEERILRNKLLAIKFKIEDYIQSENVNSDIIDILDFVKMYLQILRITKKELAIHFEMKDSNLHKYLTGERRLSPTVALKLSAFSHISPEYWYRIQIKNELIALNKEKEKMNEYKKYDFILANLF